VTELLDEIQDRAMPLKISVDWLPKVDSSIGEVRSFFVPNGDNGESEGCIRQRIHPGMTIPYPRAPTGRTEHRLHQLLCFVDLRAPRWGADHFTHIPGCQVAPFAFTASPVGAKKNEKIFEKRSSHRPGIGACLCSSGRKGDVAGNHGRKTRSGLPRPHRKKKNQAIRFFQTLP